ncbi:hypothetical protein ACLIYC_003987 [Salmonella enterica subsp. enterica serovar Montevideo]
MTTTRNKQQVPEITAAMLIKDSAECLASVPALIQQANAKKNSVVQLRLFVQALPAR